MRGFLLDTNCISEVVKPRPDPRLVNWLEAADESALYLSVLTLGEIRKGVALLPEGRRRAELDAWLTTGLTARFAGRILPVDDQVADRWGQLTARAKAAGVTLGAIDSLLAATALHHNLTVVSRNMSDFAATQAPLLNPWEG